MFDKGFENTFLFFLKSLINNLKHKQSLTFTIIVRFKSNIDGLILRIFKIKMIKPQVDIIYYLINVPIFKKKLGKKKKKNLKAEDQGKQEGRAQKKKTATALPPSFPTKTSREVFLKSKLRLNPTKKKKKIRLNPHRQNVRYTDNPNKNFKKWINYSLMTSNKCFWVTATERYRQTVTIGLAVCGSPQQFVDPPPPLD